MNTRDEKYTVDAAQYFKEEILDIMPTIPLEELSDMVRKYIYYQQPAVSEYEAITIVKKTCCRTMALP